MENNPLWLAFAQLVVLIANAYLFARQKSTAELGKHDTASFGLDVRNALQLATQASAKVETIEVGHYKVLLAKYEGVIVELRDAQAQIKCLQETVDSLGNKLASRERADRSFAKKAAKEHQDEPKEPDPSDVDALVKNGMAIPLSPNHPEPAGIPRTFGKKMR